MLENGMIVGADRHDPQQQDQELFRCCKCGEMVTFDEITSFSSGDDVCKDCLSDYLREHDADFVDPYISEYEKYYLMDWWWAGLDDNQKLEIVRQAYKNHYAPECKQKEMVRDRQEFCREDPDFPAYVKEHLQ